MPYTDPEVAAKRYITMRTPYVCVNNFSFSMVGLRDYEILIKPMTEIGFIELVKRGAVQAKLSKVEMIDELERYVGGRIPEYAAEGRLRFDENSRVLWVSKMPDGRFRFARVMITKSGRASNDFQIPVQVEMKLA